MPSPTRRTSSRKRSAATRIQKRVRGKQTRKQVTKLKATRRIQSRVRGNTTRKLITRIRSNMLVDNDCSICLEPMTEKVATLLPCGHRFHSECIKNWMTSRKKKCPNCKRRVTNIKPQTQTSRQAPIILPQLTQTEQTQLQETIARLGREIEQVGEELEELQDSTLPPLQRALDYETRAILIETAITTLHNEVRDRFYNYRTYGGVDTDNNTYYEFLEEMYNRTNDLAVDATNNSSDATGIVESIRNTNTSRNRNRNSWWPW